MGLTRMAFRIFGGWDARQAEAAEVFKYSVLAQASIPVTFQFLRIDEVPITRTGTTAFSYSRFLCPWCCDYDGIALFCDCVDQLCLGDVAELAAIAVAEDDRMVPRYERPALWVVKHHGDPFQESDRPRVWSSMMLLDCAQLSWWTPGYIETAHDHALMKFSGISSDRIGMLPLEWNMLATPGLPDPNFAKLIHWSYLSDPNGDSWIERSGSKLWAEWRERWRTSR